MSIDETLVVPLDEIQVDKQLRFVDKPVKLMNREVEDRRHNRIPMVRVRWNSKQGPKYTLERDDQLRLKYPHLFKTNPSNTESAA